MVLVNPTSGKGRGARAATAALPVLEAAGHRVRLLMGSDAADAEARLRAAVRPGCRAVIAVGGDGLVHTALQVVAGTGVPLGIIPAGTGNDIARSAGLPRRDPVAAARVVAAGHTRTLDLARSGERWFATVLAAGFDAIVNERANAMRWPRGQMRYNIATVAELRTFRALPYQLELDGRRVATEAMLVAVGNGPSFGGGLQICAGAQLDDGLLDVVLIKPMSRTELVRTYPKLFKGTHVSHPLYERHLVRQVTVAAPGIVGYADGERIAALPLTVRAVPGALEVFA